MVDMPDELAKGLGRPIQSMLEAGIISKSTIKEQDIYKRGLVRFNNNNELINTVTGKVYKNLTEAIKGTSQLGIAEVDVLTGLTGVLSPDLPGLGVLSDLTYNINRYLRLDNPEAKEFRANNTLLSSLQEKNIEIVRIGYRNTSKETVNQFIPLYKDKITYPDLKMKDLENRVIAGDVLPPGHIATRDGQAILLRLRYQTDEGYKYLTGEETSEFLNLVDAQPFNINRLARLINPLNADGSMDFDRSAEQILGGQMGKSAKRQAQSIVERNMVIRQEGVGEIVNHLSKNILPQFRNVAPKTLEDSYLFFSPALETTLKAFDLEKNYTNKLLGNPLLDKNGQLDILRVRTGTRIAMEGETVQSAQQYFRTTLELQGLAGDDEFNEFASVIKSTYKEIIADKKNQKISLDDIISRLTLGKKDPLIDSGLKYQRYINALGEMKKIDDGSGFITGIPVRIHAENLKSLIEEATAILDANTYSKGSDEFINLTANVSSYKSELDRIVTNSDAFLGGKKLALRPFEHDTARMFIGKNQGKSVFDLIQGEMEEKLGNLGFFGAASEELLKKELSFARLEAPGSKDLGPHVGQQITMQINKGHGRDVVYTEPQAIIFHQGQYGQDYKNQLHEAARTFNEEIDNIEKNIVSERLRGSILRDANLDLEGMDLETLVDRFGSKANAVRIKTNAINLQEILSSGRIKVNKIPEIANMLLDQAQRNAFRLKGTYREFVNGSTRDIQVYDYAMPYAQRQAIDTEGAMSRRGNAKVLGSGRGTTFSRFTAESGDKLSLFKFRHVRHKMLIPDAASTSLGLYEAGGGFDLDDKWITNLQSIKNSQGQRQLVAFAWRQPTGPQEFALMSPHLDEDTIMRMFGDETEMGDRFRRVSNSVSDMINKRTGFVLDISSDLSRQPSALSMEQLSKEEKIFKYLNSLAHGSINVAQRFKQSAGDITQEDLQRAIFKLVDLNGQNIGVTEFTLDTIGGGQVSISNDDFARQYMGAPVGKGAEAIKNKYLNIGATSDVIIKKAAMTKQGTMAALNVDEILRSGDSGIISSYRQSTMTQIMKKSIALNVDNKFIKSIEDIYESPLTGKGKGSYEKLFIKANSGKANIGKMEFAVRVSGSMYQASVEQGLDEIAMRS